MEAKISVLTLQKSLQQLMGLGAVQKNKLDWPVVYSGQVPNVCLIVFKGEILINQENMAVSDDNPIILGLQEIINSAPSPNDVVIKKNSEFIYFDKISASKKQSLIRKLTS